MCTSDANAITFLLVTSWPVKPDRATVNDSLNLHTLHVLLFIFGLY